jgi:hypothetical protein
MRELTDRERLERFMRALGDAAAREGTCTLTGGATAVLCGWRETTVDIDVALDPAGDELLRALARLKDELRVNVELASPADFIPLPAGWEERAITVARHGKLTFRHFDPYSQALAKIERAHARDLEDVRAMLERNLVEPRRLLACFEEIEPSLYRYPAIDPVSFRRRVQLLAKA